MSGAHLDKEGGWNREINSSPHQSITTSWNTRSIVGQITPLLVLTSQFTSKQLRSHLLSGDISHFSFSGVDIHLTTGG